MNKAVWHVIVSVLVTCAMKTDHLPTTYQPPTDHLPTIYRPSTDHLPTTFLQCSLFTITQRPYKYKKSSV